MIPIGIITGMASEAQCLETALVEASLEIRPIIRVAGANSIRAGELARELAMEGVSGLMSFGVAGGLHPSYGMGDILIPTVVQNEVGDKIVADQNWQVALIRLYESHGPVRSGAMLTVDRVLATGVEKAAYHQKTRAAGVDMESFPVGEVADEFDLPFSVLRLIFDAADSDLPESSLRVINDDGTINPGRVIRELLRNPMELGPLLSAGRKAGAAKKKMKELALGGLPFFGLF